MSIALKDKIPVGSKDAARRAKKMVGRYRDYSLVFDNCHQFTSGCITGNFENSDNFWSFLKVTAHLELSANTWHVWGTDGKAYV